MKKRLENISCLFFIILILSGCHKPRNFYEDTNNPGLSRLTARGYDIATCYINGEAYINPYVNHLLGGGNSLISIGKIQTSTIKDTLLLSWKIEKVNMLSTSFADYFHLFIFIPIDKNFTKKDFESLNGKRFPYDAVTNVTMKVNDGNSPETTDSASIYFVNVAAELPRDSSARFSFSGLFQGKIGTAIAISNGRFDFSISEADLNF